MSCRIVEHQESLVIFSKLDDKMLVSNCRNNINYIYDLRFNCRYDLDLGDLGDLSVFSAVFSEDSAFLVILAYSRKTDDLEKVLIINTNECRIIKEITLKKYIKKEFLTITELKFYQGWIVLSFCYSDATGSILFIINTKNNYDVKLRFFENIIIQHLFCNKQNITLICCEKRKRLTQNCFFCSVEYSNIFKSTQFDFSEHTHFNYKRILYFDRLQNIAFVLVHKKGVFDNEKILLWNIENAHFQLLNVKDISTNKIQPLQIIGNNDLFVGLRKETDSLLFKKKNTFHVYSFMNFNKIADFLVETDTLSIYTKEDGIDLLHCLSKKMANDENYKEFVFSSTARFSLLKTNKHIYIFETNPQFLDYIKKQSK